MRKLPATAAEDLLELVMRRYERASTLLTSNRPVEDWGKLLGDTAAVTAHARPPAAPRATSSSAARAAGARACTASGRPRERDAVDDAARFASERHDLGGGGYRRTPENAACSVRHGRATTHSLGRRRLWPVLPRPRMAGFEMSTEAFPNRRRERPAQVVGHSAGSSATERAVPATTTPPRRP